MKPIVSICCNTYNHEKYIAECLEGFVMQKTNFEFEILVHDDASTDKTARILRDYELKYPKLFRCVYQTENQFYKQNTLTSILFPMSKGKYIAICEGDDYWTDPMKLQKQVNLLESNKDLIACHHWQKIATKIKGAFVEIDAPKEGHGYFPEKIAKVNRIFSNDMRVKVRTLIFRNIIDEHFIPEWFYNVPFGDVPLSFLLGEYGSFGFIDEPMAVYRQTDDGISKAGLKELGLKRFSIQHFKNWIEIWDYANKHYEYEYHEDATETVNGFYKIIITNLPVSVLSLVKVLYYNVFERKMPIHRTLSNSNWIVSLYVKKIGFKLKKKLQFK
jgi:glycosyltransferase involved in cell wall biosynthesis